MRCRLVSPIELTPSTKKGKHRKTDRLERAVDRAKLLIRSLTLHRCCLSFLFLFTNFVQTLSIGSDWSAVNGVFQAKRKNVM